MKEKKEIKFSFDVDKIIKLPDGGGLGKLIVDNLEVDLDKYEVKLDGKVLKDFKPKEIQLLYFFMSNKNQVFTREQLLDKVWGYEYYGGTRTVDVHVKGLREKLKSKKSKWEITTIWNVGYKFEMK